MSVRTIALTLTSMNIGTQYDLGSFCSIILLPPIFPIIIYQPSWGHHAWHPPTMSKWCIFISNVLNILNPSIIKSTNLVNDDWPLDLGGAYHCHQNWPSPSLSWWSRRTWPKTTCLPSSHWVLAVHRKNWEPLVFGPALAMESTPGEMREKLGHSLAAHKYDQNRLNCNFCTVLPFPYWSRIGRSKSVEMRDA